MRPTGDVEQLLSGLPSRPCTTVIPSKGRLRQDEGLDVDDLYPGRATTGDDSCSDIELPRLHRPAGYSFVQQVDVDDDKLNEDDNVGDVSLSINVSQFVHQLKLLRQARLLLYVSHFFSKFTQGAWEFVVILFLAAISHNQSILLVSTYYLTTYAAVSVFAAPLGSFVDQTNRLVAARLCIVLQYCSILVAIGACCWLLTKNQRNGSDSEGSIPHDVFSVILLVVIHAFGATAQVLDQAFEVAVERDWIVLMSEQLNQAGKDGAAAALWLSSTNVSLRQIDLICKVAAPLVAGLVIGQSTNHDDTITDARKHHNHYSWCDLHETVVLVTWTSLTAMLMEYICTSMVYRLTPALCERKITGNGIEETNNDDDTCIGNHPLEKQKEKMQTSCSSLRNGALVYAEQKVVWAGISLAILYVNTLSFGGIMTTFLLWKGMSREEVGLWRSIENITGLLGTLAFQLLTKFTTVVNAGEVSILFFFGCLTVAVASFFIRDDKWSMHMLVGSCAASRTGLWTFDIAVTFLYQTHVPEGIRGLVGGTQQALNSFFVVLIGCLGIFLRRPKDFYLFAGTSYVGITLCMIVYSVGIFCRQGNLKTPNNL